MFKLKALSEAKMTLLSASNQIAILGRDLIKFEIVKFEDRASLDVS